MRRCRSGWNARFVLAAALMAGALGLGSCGVPTDDHFRVSRLPPALAVVRTTPTTPTTTTSTTTSTVVSTTLAVSVPTEAAVSTTLEPVERVKLYFVRNGFLVPMERSLSQEVTPGRVLTLLEFGPDAAEPGVRSVVDLSMTDSIGQLLKGKATLSLSSTFSNLPPSEQRLAIAQLVLTLTSLRGIGQVEFRRDGALVAVPLPDGISTSDPVAADDFRSLLEPPSLEVVVKTEASTSTTSTPTTVAVRLRRTRARGRSSGGH